MVQDKIKEIAELSYKANITKDKDEKEKIEQDVQTILKDLKKDHTVIIITHKKDLMKVADKLIVIDKGKLVGIGKHKKLLEENKYYKRLFKQKN